MKAEERAKAMISKLSLEELLTQWELTSEIKNENIPTVRGWLMDELEKRNPEGYEAWLDSELAEDSELRNYMM